MAHAFLNISNPVEVRQRCIKTAYPSRKMAFLARGKMGKAEGLADAGSGRLQVYRCSICGQWHLGHKSR